VARTDDLALLIGRCGVASLFIPDGFDKLIHFQRFASSLVHHGLPHPTVWAALGVIADFGGALAILIGFEVRWTSLILVVFIAMASALSHRYWEIADAARHRAQEAQFYKNLALIGGLLFLHVSGAGAYSIDARRGKSRRH
jgi:putative oxidoreductase